MSETTGGQGPGRRPRAGAGGDGGGSGGPGGAGEGDAPARRDADVAAPLARRLLALDTPEGVRRLVRALAIVCAALLLFDLLWHRHAKVPGEGLWGFHAFAGFIAFTLIVLGAKQLRRLIRRDEDYYAPRAIDAEPYPERGLGRLDARAGEEAGELLRVVDGRVVDRAADADGRGGPGDPRAVAPRDAAARESDGAASAEARSDRDGADGAAR